jgi:hypothetical protein
MKLLAFRHGFLGSLAVMAIFAFASASADAATIVALGASNTFGKGVARNQAYPAQLEAILRAKGANVRVVNAGINGDTTEGMLQRLDRPCRTGPALSSCSRAATTGARARLIEHRKFRAGCRPGASRWS